MAKKKKSNDFLHVGIDQLMTPTGKIITFNDEQLEGINKIRHWLKNGQTFFTLAGYAGTGKSTCIKKIIDEYHRRIVVSAPTHKAKKVLMNTTDMEAQTLHSLLGLRPDVDLDSFNPNDPEFAPIADPKIGNYDFVIIDEAFMINQDLYNMIVEKTKDIEIKVLFMGDPAQIPPVGEKESVVFSQQTNEFHQLTKIERQNESNPIFFVTDALRNNLTDPNGGFERISRTNKNGEGITFITDKQEFRNAILEKYTADEFRRNTDYAKVIAWRNKTVMGANKVIRTALFGENSDIIEVGDILMGYRSVRSSNARYNIIENSADYRVVAKSELEENKYKIMGWRVKIREDLPHGKFKIKEIFIVDISDHDNLHRYAELHDINKEYGKKHREMGSWTEYYNFRKNNILIKTINKHKDGSPRSKYDVIVKDMDYGMAITAHKCLSEDSWVQRNNGFVKLKDIKIGDVVCCGNNINEKVIDKIYTGKKRSFKLKTSLGYEIRCSEDHKILNIDGNFQSLINFNIGDYIPINRNKINDEINVYERDINYYMGLLVADGWYSGSNKRDKYRILLTISLDDGENIQFIKEFYKNNNINFGEYSYKNRKIINIGVSNKKWREYLQALGLEYVKGEEKSIPPSVLNGSLQQKSNFIAGLFDGDGSVNNKGLIRFVNNSYILIKQIQNILLEFGIISSYHEHKKSYTLSILYTSIPLFKKFISFRLSRKKDKLNNYIPTNKTNIDFVPFKNKIVSIIRSDLQKKNQWNMKNCGVFLCDHRKLSYFFRYKYISYYHLENIIQLYEINQIPVNSFIEKIYHNHYFYDKIVEIIEEKEIDMYDLEIENIHQYIADGFIVHNSQGSTYTHVFVMENDIDVNWLIKERNQLKYTSFTRPTTSVTVLTNKIE
jgi:intein/homing endonuclease